MVPGKPGVYETRFFTPIGVKRLGEEKELVEGEVLAIIEVEAKSQFPQSATLTLTAVYPTKLQTKLNKGQVEIIRRKTGAVSIHILPLGRAWGREPHGRIIIPWDTLDLGMTRGAAATTAAFGEASNMSGYYRFERSVEPGQRVVQVAGEYFRDIATVGEALP